MSPFRSFLLVMQREVVERARTRSYLISTVVIVVLGVAGVAAANFVPAFFEDDPRRVGVVEGAIAPADLESAGAVFDVEMEVIEYPDRPAGEFALSDQDIQALVDVDEIVYRESTDAMLTNAVTQALGAQSFEDRLEQAGLTPEEAQQLLAPDLDVTLLEPGDPADDLDGASVAVAFVGAIALFIVIISVGNTVLMGIVEEKTSRVVEVLLGAMRPGSLLAGKVVGISVLGIAQLMLGAGTALAALLIIDPPDISMPDLPAMMIPVILAYLVLGVIFYTFSYAAIGATVSRQEEASNASAPVTVVLVAVYIFAINFTIREPDAEIARLVALLPPFSPIAMPPRYALTDVPLWELGLSLLLMAVACWLVIRLGERIYTAAILRVGPRIGLRHALRQSREQS